MEPPSEMEKALSNATISIVTTLITAIKKLEYTNWNEGGNGVRKFMKKKQTKKEKKKSRA